MIYAINRGNQPIGSYSREDVLRGVKDGQLMPTDFVWRQEEQRWVPLSEFLAALEANSSEEMAVSAFVGKKYFTYYKAKWATLTPRKQFAWNWAAFFAGPFWLAYRKMYPFAWGYLAFIAALDICEVVFHLDKAMTSWPSVVFGITVGRVGNYWYKQHVSKRIETVTPVDVQRLANAGGTSVGAVVALLAGFLAWEVPFAILTNG